MSGSACSSGRDLRSGCDRRASHGSGSGRRRSSRSRRSRSGRRRRGRRGGGRSGRRRSRRSRRRGEEVQRVHVTVRILRVADAEVDVRSVVFDFPRRADRPDARPLGYGLAAQHRRRTEMGQCHGVAVGRLDRYDFATRRDRADKRNCPRHSRHNRVSGGRADVDSAVLTRGIWIVSEDEFLEHGAFDRPSPRSSGGHDHESRHECGDQGSTHLLSPCCPVCQQSPHYLEQLFVVNMDYRDVS
jgi:hypothetical protein